MTKSYSIEVQKSIAGGFSAYFIHHLWGVVSGEDCIVKSRHSTRPITYAQHKRITKFVNDNLHNGRGEFQFYRNCPQSWTFHFMDDVYKMGGGYDD